MDLKILLNELRELNLPKGEYVVVGSAAMAARGIREAKDLDVLVSKDLWKELIKTHPVSKKACEYVEIGNIEFLGTGTMYRDASIVDVDEIFQNAKEIDGIPFLDLENLKKVKAWRADPKDFRDIELINEYQQKTPPSGGAS